MDIGNHQLCPHCDEFLPRRTVYRHTRNIKRKRELEDHRRWKRCKDSSDEEETCIGPLRQQLLQQSEIETEDDQTVASTKDHSDNEVIDEHVWEGELEEEMDMDIGNKNDHNFCPRNGESVTEKAHRIVKWILCSLLYLQNAYMLSNNCVEHIQLLLQQIFNVLGKLNLVCRAIASIFPLSVYMLRKWTAFERDNFKKYLVCPNCMAIYDYHEIVCNVGERVLVKKCSNKVFGCRVDASSENKGKRGRFKCEATLVREVTLTSGKKYYPLKIFCYKHVINSLEKQLARTGFLENCNLWRNREHFNDTYCDIFDGDIWKHFQTYKGEPYLSDQNNVALMINVDWFQPFKRRKDVSVGVLYLVFLNLPRHLRFKAENIILLGIIPALKKEPNSLNSFLQPLVEELKILEKGIDLFPNGNQIPFRCKALLLCAASDIPAARKLCGFMGHFSIAWMFFL